MKLNCQHLTFYLELHYAILTLIDNEATTLTVMEVVVGRGGARHVKSSFVHTRFALLIGAAFEDGTTGLKDKTIIIVL